MNKTIFAIGWLVLSGKANASIGKELYQRNVAAANVHARRYEICHRSKRAFSLAADPIGRRR